MGFIDFTVGDTPGASDFDEMFRQTIMRFDDTGDRDSALSAVLEEGLVVQTLDDETFWRYNDGLADWEILFEREKAWTSPTITQGSSVAHTVNWGSYSRSYGRWDAALKVTFTAAGAGGNPIQITAPFTVIGMSGSFTFFDDTLSVFRQGGVLGVSSSVCQLVIDLGADFFGVSGADGITADDVLWLDLHGSY